MNAVLILNREAGALVQARGQATPEALRDAFAAHGTRVNVQLASPDNLETVLRAALRQQPDGIMVGGGDGTISTAARCLAGSGVPLGVLPLGTFNHFARDLGLPTDWEGAVAALAGGVTRAVDAGEVNGCIFINNCSIGSYPEAVRVRDQLRREHGRGKWIAMTLASATVFRRLKRFRLSIQLPDTTLSLRAPFVFIGNNRYTGNLLRHSLRPRMDEGQLSIYTTRARRHLTVAWLAWQSLVRSIDSADALETHLAPEAVVTSLTGQALPVAVDGELANLVEPFRFRIRPRALLVFTPAVTDEVPRSPAQPADEAPARP